MDPELFRRHLAEIDEWGGNSLTVSDLAERVRASDVPDRALAITFDDGFASVARFAAPLLAKHGLTATVFCVAGHLGGRNDWPTQPAGAPKRALASARELKDLAAQGFEIGSHGLDHVPLVSPGTKAGRRELLDSRELLEEAVGGEVRSLAYPYGVVPPSGMRRWVRDAYVAACTAHPGRISSGSDPYALPRVDIHYVRHPGLLRRALGRTLDPYLRARGFAARARRVVRKDYAGVQA